MWNADLFGQRPGTKGCLSVPMVEIDLSDELVDLVGEDIFASALDFVAITGDVEGCLTSRLRLAAYNCSIAIPGVSSGAAVNKGMTDWKTTMLGKTGWHYILRWRRDPMMYSSTSRCLAASRVRNWRRACASTV